MGEKKLNITMLGHKRIPSREGGIEIVVEELATRMAALGHHVTCLNRAGEHVAGAENDAKEQKAFRGVTIKTVPTLDKRGLAAMTASVTGAMAAAFSKCDVVHFHAEGPCAMLWLPKLLGKDWITNGPNGVDSQKPIFFWERSARPSMPMRSSC